MLVAHLRATRLVRRPRSAGTCPLDTCSASVSCGRGAEVAVSRKRSFRLGGVEWRRERVRVQSHRASARRPRGAKSGSARTGWSDSAVPPPTPPPHRRSEPPGLPLPRCRRARACDKHGWTHSCLRDRIGASLGYPAHGALLVAHAAGGTNAVQGARSADARVQRGRERVAPSEPTRAGGPGWGRGLRRSLGHRVHLAAPEPQPEPKPQSAGATAAARAGFGAESMKCRGEGIRVGLSKAIFYNKATLTGNLSIFRNHPAAALLRSCRAQQRKRAAHLEQRKAALLPGAVHDRRLGRCRRSHRRCCSEPARLVSPDILQRQNTTFFFLKNNHHHRQVRPDAGAELRERWE